MSTTPTRPETGGEFQHGQIDNRGNPYGDQPNREAAKRGLSRLEGGLRSLFEGREGSPAAASETAQPLLVTKEKKPPIWRRRGYQITGGVLGAAAVGIAAIFGSAPNDHPDNWPVLPGLGGEDGDNARPLSSAELCEQLADNPHFTDAASQLLGADVGLDNCDPGELGGGGFMASWKGYDGSILSVAVEDRFYQDDRDKDWFDVYNSGADRPHPSYERIDGFGGEGVVGAFYERGRGATVVFLENDSMVNVRLSQEDPLKNHPDARATIGIAELL